MAYKEEERSWYLKDNPFFIISFLFAPLALIILFVKRKELDQETMSDRLFIAGLFMLIFMAGLLPKSIYTFIMAILLYLFTGLLLVIKLFVANKNHG